MMKLLCRLGWHRCEHGHCVSLTGKPWNAI